MLSLSLSPVERKSLLVIILVAWLFRLSILIPVLYHPERSLHNDTASYLAIAQNLSSGHGYSHCQELPYWPNVMRTPVYPFFLAGLLIIFDGNLGLIVLAQIFLDLLITGMIYSIGIKFFNYKTALFASLLYASSMVSVGMTGFLITETLFTFLITVLLALLLKYRRYKERRQVMLIAVVWVLCTLCRPIALFALPMVALFVMILEQDEIVKQVKTVGLYLCLSLLLLSPWLYRNYQITGYLTISSIVDFGLLTYNAANLIAFQEGVLPEEIRGKLEKEVKRKTGKRLEECQPGHAYIGEYRTRGRAVIKKHPLLYCYVHLRSTPNNLLPAVTDILELWGLTNGGKGTLGVINRQGWSAGVKHYFGDDLRLLYFLIPWIILWGILLVSVVMGIMTFWQKRIIDLILILGGFTLFFLLVPGPSSCPRFSAPAVPFLAIMGGYGLANWKQLYKKILSKLC